jgi:hypothetical protein
MKIVACGEKEERLLNLIFSYLERNKCRNLNLINLKYIQVDDAVCRDGVNARYCQGTIYIDGKAIGNILEKIDIDLKDDSGFDLLKSDYVKIFMNEFIHELYHCDAEAKMLSIHNVVYDEECDFWMRITAHFWIECYVGYRSGKNQYCFEKQYNQEMLLLHQIIGIKWNITHLYENKNECKNMQYLSYMASYFVTINLVYDLDAKYLFEIADDDVKNLFGNLIEEVKRLLQRKIIIDDYAEIKQLEMIFREYYKKTI